MQQLEGAFALVFKSSLFPNECVATRRGSPMLIGVKSGRQMNNDQIPVRGPQQRHEVSGHKPLLRMTSAVSGHQPLIRFPSAAGELGVTESNGMEYFFASDASAIIEHTKRVIYLEDGDVAWVREGNLKIAHTTDVAPGTRELQTLHMNIQEIMKVSKLIWPRSIMQLCIVF